MSISELLDKLINRFNIPKLDIHNYLPGGQAKLRDNALIDYHLTKIEDHYYFRHNKTRDIYLYVTGEVYFYIHNKKPEMVSCILPSLPTNNLQHYIPEKVFERLIDRQHRILMAGKITLDDGRIKKWRPLDIYSENSYTYHKALDSGAVRNLLTVHLIN